ncbi:MAG: DNA internalization-related competence protein ComEC/Rec2 [uncultured Sphingosinicella sp.]|uniref:DNA internalization-related competence protein ComEC/Rec2 n=1 Tax=uncultured Sphingosinicella sp. TaxID=478748 RepID=A0A6J4TVA7_9SPHN|nr:ComEC/Rec2 family competence protein [uncultured Sphingosinicella sp.]CAA9531357.1 MAG: DNA internalization-related competence protein ComEC/Rec2 [uncultured Sphingosinicella sp.]
MAEFTARIESVQKLPAREVVRLVVAPTGSTNLPPRLRINIDDEDAKASLEPGATVRLKAWLMPPAPMAVPGAFNFAQAAWFQGIGGTGRASRIELVAPSAEQGWRARLSSVRQRLADHVRSRLAGGPGAIAAALATGDQSAISEKDAEAMRASGLAHLLSVSGLHLTAVVGAVMLLTMKLLALSPTLALRLPLVPIAAGVGALAGVAYTLLTGAEVPTIRACVAALLVLLALALGRDALTLRLLAVGALIVLLFWPESLAGPSFQLSFAAITAIVALHEHPWIKALLARREEGAIQKLGRGLLALILTGLVVEAALMPIALYHFHKAGFYGALANVVAIPLTTFVIMPLEALALLFDLVGAGAPVWWLTGVALDFLLGLANLVASAPGAVATLPTMPRAAFALIVGGGLWLALWRTRWRCLGLLPIAAGVVWALATPAPDLIVTGEGKHLALRTSSGKLAILRSRAGDYVRDILGESAGEDGELGALEDAVPCSPDLCRAEVARDGRVWRILATQSPHHVPWPEMIRACAEADIVISDRRLPRGCTPRWLRADRGFLQRTGGLSIVLGDRSQVSSVSERVGSHPWASRLQ